MTRGAFEACVRAIEGGAIDSILFDWSISPEGMSYFDPQIEAVLSGIAGEPASVADRSPDPRTSALRIATRDRLREYVERGLYKLDPRWSRVLQRAGTR